MIAHINDWVAIVVKDTSAQVPSEQLFVIGVETWLLARLILPVKSCLVLTYLPFMLALLS